MTQSDHLLMKTGLLLVFYRIPHILIKHHGAKKADIFNRGAPILFHLSGSGGGAKAVIGSARVTYSEIMHVDEVGSLDRQGVLSGENRVKISDKSEKIHVFTFDNFNSFPVKIPFRYMRKNSMISGANLVTVESLSHKHLLKLCNMGFGMEKMK